MRLKSLLLPGLVAFTLMHAGLAHADSLYGSCQWRDGSKCGSSVRISTSWNSKKAYPSGGQYTLQFDSKVGSRITVYCNGEPVGTIRVDGNTRMDIVCR